MNTVHKNFKVDDKIKFIGRLEQAMKSQYFSKAELARRVGVTASHIGKVLNGDGGASELFVKQLAVVLAVRFDWLAYGEGPQKEHGEFARLTESEKECLDVVRKLPEQLTSVVRDVAKSLGKSLYGQEWNEKTSPPKETKSLIEDILSGKSSFSDDDDFDEESPT